MTKNQIKIIGQLFSATIILSFFCLTINPINIALAQEEDTPIELEPDYLNTQLQLEEELGQREGLLFDSEKDPASPESVKQDAANTLTSISSTDATGCLAQVAGSTVANWLGDFFSKGASIINQKLLTLEVPVAVDSLESKETGVDIYGFTVWPGKDALAYCLGNLIVEAMLDSAIAWVRGGFEDNPAFVDDPEQFFTDLADREVGILLDELTDGYLCAPWKINIKLALLRQYQDTQIRSCTVSEIVDNLENFVNGNFKDGGWKGWFELTQESGNNAYGSYVALDREMIIRQTASANTADIEFTWSSGFFSKKDPDSGEITTPGKTFEGFLANTVNIPANRLTVADEFDELLDALVNELLLKSVGDILE